MPATPVYIICSPRPQVGKTLIARLLCEFQLLKNGNVVGFDINLKEPSLLEYLPQLTETADVMDTFGKMRLMDRVIADDGYVLRYDASDPSSTVVAIANPSLPPFGWTYLEEKPDDLGLDTAAYYQTINAPATLGAFIQRYGMGTGETIVRLPRTSHHSPAIPAALASVSIVSALGAPEPGPPLAVRASARMNDERA